MTNNSKCYLLLLLLLVARPSLAETVKFDSYELHYTVVNSTFVQPAVAARYQIVRARDRAFINLAVRERLPAGGDRAVTAVVEGRSWDLFHNQFLEFREIREGEAIYYIADFKFSDSELRFFDLAVLPAGAKRSKQLKFQHRVYDD
jgi:hypothetical protein